MFLSASPVFFPHSSTKHTLPGGQGLWGNSGSDRHRTGKNDRPLWAEALAAFLVIKFALNLRAVFIETEGRCTVQPDHTSEPRLL